MNIDGEKGETEEFSGNNTYHPGLTDSDYDEGTGAVCPPHTTERKLIARIDWHLMPFVIVLYLLAFLDRVNIANAKSFGLKADLNLGGVEYNTALTIFFVPYVFFEVPSNILLKKFSPKIWLPGCMFAFGLISIFQGLVQNYAGLVSCDVLPLAVHVSRQFGNENRKLGANLPHSLLLDSSSASSKPGCFLAVSI